MFYSSFFFLMIPPPPISTLFPYTTLFRSVRLVVAVEDAHQSRLAGAVLADDAMDRARSHHERDVPVRVDRAEALVDPPQLDRRGRVRVYVSVYQSAPSGGFAAAIESWGRYRR